MKRCQSVRRLAERARPDAASESSIERDKKPLASGLEPIKIMRMDLIGAAGVRENCR